MRRKSKFAERGGGEGLRSEILSLWKINLQSLLTILFHEHGGKPTLLLNLDIFTENAQCYVEIFTSRCRQIRTGPLELPKTILKEYQ